MPLRQSSSRAGRYIKQLGGYQSFVPAALPPTPAIQFDNVLLDLLSRADRAVGRLDGCAETLPNSELFVFMYIRKEAVLSSQIEGTEASLMDVLEFEAASREAKSHDVGEVFNYVSAMKHGLGRLKTLPLSLRLIREIHSKLLSGVSRRRVRRRIQGPAELDRPSRIAAQGRLVRPARSPRHAHGARQPGAVPARRRAATLSGAGRDRARAV